MTRRVVWIGFDPRERDAFTVAVASLRAHATVEFDIRVVDLSKLIAAGLYQRPVERRGQGLYDPISGAPMSTEFAISRFLVPLLSTQFCDEPWEWALFIDCDMLFRADVAELFALADPKTALQCVKHRQEAGPAIKMDGQAQTFYARKNWSSVMLFNLWHPALRTLTLQKINTWTGRALHALNWVADEFIGELPPEWNHLVGVEPERLDAKLVHFTLGIPSMPGYQSCEHSDEWFAVWRSTLPEAEPRPS